MKYNIDEIIGKKFEKLTILEIIPKIRGVVMCKCKCDCGTEKHISLWNILRRSTKSCGCQRKNTSIRNLPIFKSIIGNRYGRLIVKEQMPSNKYGYRIWKCKCDCGNEKNIAGVNLINGTQSCGCYAKEQTRKLLSKPPYLGIYNRLLNAAKRTNRICDITYEEYLKYTQIDKCHYCNQHITWTPYRRRNEYNSYVGYGLDRKNNNVGYTKENCVVCCPKCNHVKGNLFTEQEMLQLGKIIGEIQHNRLNHNIV
jgi:hypothetical protein